MGFCNYVPCPPKRECYEEKPKCSYSYSCHEERKQEDCKPRYQKWCG